MDAVENAYQRQNLDMQESIETDNYGRTPCTGQAMDFTPDYSLQEDNYRRQFTDALKNYVEDNRYKYAHFTDMIYVSIFKEKAKEYKKILDLKANDKVRDTFYSEILDIIAAYESGLAGAIKHEYERVEHILSIKETETLFA